MVSSPKPATSIPHTAAGSMPEFPAKKMVRAVARWSAKKRHHDRLHQKFECDAECDPAGHSKDPAPGPHISDLSPGRPRQPRPNQHQSGTDGENDHVSDGHVSGEQDRENHDDTKRSKTTQSRGEAIARRRRRFCSGRGVSSWFRQIHPAAYHVLSSARKKRCPAIVSQVRSPPCLRDNHSCEERRHNGETRWQSS